MEDLKASVERVILGDRLVETRILRGPLRGCRFVLNRATETKMWLGMFEPGVQTAIVERCRPGDVAIDVGAFAGYFTLLMERLGCRVVTLEPDPANANRTRRTLELNNSTVTQLEVAASDREGEAFLGPAGTPSEHALAETGIPVKTVTLDSLADEYGMPSLVKVDVEGAELLVMQGASDLLDHGVAFVVETHSPELDRAVRSLFADRGYAIARAENSVVADPR